MRNYLLYSNNTNLTASKNAWIKCFVFEKIYVNINDSFHTTYIEERSCFISSHHIFPSLFKIPISISFSYLRIEWRQFAQKLFFFREHIQKHVRCRLPNVTRLLSMGQFKLNLRWYFCKQKGQVEALYMYIYMYQHLWLPSCHTIVYLAFLNFLIFVIYLEVHLDSEIVETSNFPCYQMGSMPK